MGEWVSLTVAASTMRSFVTRPNEAQPPGVLVCMHAPGLDAFIQGICERLATAGFASIAPDVYHRQTGDESNPLARMAKLKDVELLEDHAVASAHLATISDAMRQSVIGFCMGGRQAFQWATEVPTLKAAVMFYGASIMKSWGDGASPFERIASIRCPVLGLFGKEDTNPSPEDVAKIGDEMDRLSKAHEFVSYDGAGHAFLNDTRPTFRPDAAQDAWRRCIDWLSRYSK